MRYVNSLLFRSVRSVLFLLFSSSFGFAQSSSLSLQSVQPNAVLSGSGTTTVTLKGNGFTSSTKVYAKNAVSNSSGVLTPVLIDTTTLQVALPSTMLTTPATMSIQVFVPDVVYSQELLFYVYSSSPPVVNAVIPAGGLPGTTTGIALTGTNLAGVTMTFSGSGVTASPDAQNPLYPPTTQYLRVAVAPDAPLGIRSVTISTPSGSTTTCGGRPCTFLVIGAGSWTDVSSASLPDQTAMVRLLDGRILVAGGAVPRPGTSPTTSMAVSSAQIFDPSTGQWITAAAMNNGRFGAVATLLSDGRVLVAGGTNDSGSVSAAEIYNPATNSWLTTGSMIAPPASDALLLPNAKVLVQRTTNSTFEAELFDPLTGSFQAMPQLSVSDSGIFSGKMVLLSDRRVLIADSSDDRNVRHCGCGSGNRA